MHQNPAFRRTPEDEILRFAAARGFGVLTMRSPEPDEAPLAAHAPFILIEDGAALELHMMRSNPIARALQAGPSAALVAVSGPDAYVSPDWYGLGPDHVPTWNYVAAHLRGRIRLLPHDDLRNHLNRLSETFESRLAPKAPWRIEKMSTEAYERMARTILPARLDIERVDGTWKMNQNKDQAGRLRAADAIESSEIGSQPTSALAAMMRGG